eukprot:m.135398 g.135398  ORF g.135398 m.135398 type:complete len:884 (-) comp9883_c0_seq8:787-3438(-)
MNIFCPTLRRVRDFSEKIFICLPGFVLGHGQPHKPDLRTMFDDTEEDEDTPAFFSIQEYSDLLASAEAQLQDLDMPPHRAELANLSAALAQSPVLHIRLGRKSAKAAATVIASLPAMMLTRLDLHSCQLDEEDAAALAEVLPRTRLQHLSLQWNTLGLTGFTALGPGLAACTTMRELDFSDTMMATKTFLTLTQFLKHSPVVSLDLSTTLLGDSYYERRNTIDAAALAQGLTELENLRHIQLHAMMLCNDGARKIADALAASQLESIVMVENRILSQGLVCLVEALPTSRIQHFSCWNEFDSAALDALTKVLPHCKLKSLSISAHGTAGTVSMTDFLVAACKHVQKSLAIRGWSGNSSQRHHVAILETLSFGSLTSLSLSMEYPDDTLHAIASNLPSSMLRRLQVCGQFSDRGIAAIAAALPHSVLEDLEISSNVRHSHLCLRSLGRHLPDSNLRRLCLGSPCKSWSGALHLVPFEDGMTVHDWIEVQAYDLVAFALGVKFSRLEMLENLGQFARNSHDVVWELVLGCPSLRFLDLSIAGKSEFAKHLSSSNVTAIHASYTDGASDCLRVVGESCLQEIHLSQAGPEFTQTVAQSHLWRNRFNERKLLRVGLAEWAPLRTVPCVLLGSSTDRLEEVMSCAACEPIEWPDGPEFVEQMQRDQLSAAGIVLLPVGNGYCASLRRPSALVLESPSATAVWIRSWSARSLYCVIISPTISDTNGNDDCAEESVRKLAADSTLSEARFCMFKALGVALCFFWTRQRCPLWPAMLQKKHSQSLSRKPLLHLCQSNSVCMAGARFHQAVVLLQQFNISPPLCMIQSGTTLHFIFKRYRAASVSPISLAGSRLSKAFRHCARWPGFLLLPPPSTQTSRAVNLLAWPTHCAP